ncbi:hypothetical protein Bbelb_062510 [Branchiostoma belcheri]|nr:hypothetical protein Bbelb_062510 [Branchiostoma belcheri]
MTDPEAAPVAAPLPPTSRYPWHPRAPTTRVWHRPNRQLRNDDYLCVIGRNATVMIPGLRERVRGANTPPGYGDRNYGFWYHVFARFGGDREALDLERMNSLLDQIGGKRNRHGRCNVITAA